MSMDSPSEFVIREKEALWFDRVNRVAQAGIVDMAEGQLILRATGPGDSE